MKYKSIHSDTQKSLDNLALFVHGFPPLVDKLLALLAIKLLIIFKTYLDCEKQGAIFCRSLNARDHLVYRELHVSFFERIQSVSSKPGRVQCMFVRNLNGEGHVNYTQHAHACQRVGLGMWQPLWAVYRRLGRQWVGLMCGLLG